MSFDFVSTAVDTASTFIDEFGQVPVEFGWLAEAAAIDRVPDDQVDAWMAAVQALVADGECELYAADRAPANGTPRVQKVRVTRDGRAEFVESGLRVTSGTELLHTADDALAVALESWGVGHG